MNVSSSYPSLSSCASNNLNGVMVRSSDRGTGRVVPVPVPCVYRLAEDAVLALEFLELFAPFRVPFVEPTAKHSFTEDLQPINDP